jgi:hypothetical protein
MAQTRTTCPRCRQSVAVDVEQLFDLNADPQAKQRLMSGQFNYIHCPNCGYEGSLSTPIVYHDADKELLLTYFPPEMGLPLNEQERLIGPLINQVVNRLQPEKRKAYLFRPQTMLTLQTMVERILEADGITREMLQAQQQRVSLLQRLLSTAPEGRLEIIHQEEQLIDENLFSILARLAEASMSQGDQQTAQQLAVLQKQLLTETKVGQEIQRQSQEAQEAIRSLQEASKKGLTREKLLDLIVDAPTPTRLTTLVNMARNGLDYTFFQLLTDKIEKSSGDEKERLTKLRSQLIDMTAEIDKAVQEQAKQARKQLETILAAPDIEQATAQNLETITDAFVEIVQADLQAARQKGDLERSGKLQKVIKVLQEASAPPPEVALVEELMETKDDESLRKVMEAHTDQITPEFLQVLNSLVMQSESQGQPPEFMTRLQTIYRSALRFSMQSNFNKKS